MPKYKSFLNKKTKNSSTGKSKTKKNSKPKKVKGPWSLNEDKLLIKWVQENGAQNWAKCSEVIKGRNGKQCREHWNNSLNNAIIKGDWSKREDLFIMVFYNKLDKSWKKMIPLFKSRTENSIKNRFYSQLRKIAAKYIKKDKKDMNSKFKLNIIVNYHELGIEEAKKDYLNENPMNEGDYDKFIKEVEDLIKNKDDNQRFIDIDSVEEKYKSNKIIKNADKNNLKYIDKNSNYDENSISLDEDDKEKEKEVTVIKIENPKENIDNNENKNNEIKNNKEKIKFENKSNIENLVSNNNNINKNMNIITNNNDINNNNNNYKIFIGPNIFQKNINIFNSLNSLNSMNNISYFSKKPSGLNDNRPLNLRQIFGEEKYNIQRPFLNNDFNECSFNRFNSNFNFDNINYNYNNCYNNDNNYFNNNFFNYNINKPPLNTQNILNDIYYYYNKEQKYPFKVSESFDFNKQTRINFPINKVNFNKQSSFGSIKEYKGFDNLNNDKPNK